MYHTRRIESRQSWSDPDGIKIYTISAKNLPVDHAHYLPRLDQVKQVKAVKWSMTPAFVIFHDGASVRYLVLAWWGNDNELFTSVSVHSDAGWVEDSTRYSFCLWDLEVFWFERNSYIDAVYCAQPDLERYRQSRLS